MLLGKIDDSKPGRVSYVYDQYMFHYLVNDGITFLCMTSLDAGERVRLPFAFLDEIRTEFGKAYGDRVKVAHFQLYCHFLSF